MPDKKSGVTPTYDLEFGVCITGRGGSDFTIVKDAESLSISIDGNIEEWNPMDQGG